MNLEPIHFNHKGVDYLVEPLTQIVQDATERYIQDKSLQMIKGMKASLSAEDYRDLLNDHIFKSNNYGYAFGSELCVKFLMVPKHFVWLIWVLLSKAQPTLQLMDVQKLVDDDLEAWMDLLGSLCRAKKFSSESTSEPSVSNSSPGASVAPISEPVQIVT